MHTLLNRIFSSEMQRPSSDQLWHTPQLVVAPSPLLPGAPLLDPLEAQLTSYFAASAKIDSLPLTSMRKNISMSATVRKPALRLSQRRGFKSARSSWFLVPRFWLVDGGCRHAPAWSGFVTELSAAGRMGGLWRRSFS